MATLLEWKELIRFAKNTNDINPNMLTDIKRKIISPSKALNDFIKDFNKNKNKEMLPLK